MIRRPPRSTLFPSTPLSRSRERDVDVGVRFARIIPGQDADREPAGLLRAPRRGRHHAAQPAAQQQDRKSTRLNSSHLVISYAVFCLKKKKNIGSTSLISATH